MISLTLHSSEPPAIVLRSLKAHAGEWRTSQLPDALRRAGVLTVEAKVYAGTCTVSYRRRWYGPIERGLALRVRATTLPEASGTTVEITARYEVRYPWLAALLVAVFMLACLMLLPRPLWPVVALVVVSYAVSFPIVREMNRNLSRTGNSEADYLIRRLEEAVADAKPTGAEPRAS